LGGWGGGGWVRTGPSVYLLAPSAENCEEEGGGGAAVVLAVADVLLLDAGAAG